MDMTRTKIICTLGPASSSETIIRKMAFAGMDVVRLNFSHGSWELHKERIDIVRKINKKYRRHIKILQDLEGFRIRIGRLRAPIELKRGEFAWLTQEDVIGEGDLLPFDYNGRLDGVKKGQFIYIDDGNIALKVVKVERKRIKVQAMIGGLIKEYKGINIPDAKLDFPPFTQKDKRDLEFGIKNGVDFVAQSFVRNKRDVLAVKRLVDCPVVAKIENQEALRNIDDIIDASDGIMIARGDLGVSVPIYQIPIIQKQIIKRCKWKKRFVITATQMLESMTEHHRPTRAEVTDVANAILDGTDYVMLSGETAVGKYPVEVVRMMDQIIKYTEENICV